MKARSKKDKASASSRIADARFASFETDPRFRLPSKKRTKTTLDKRFSGMLEDEEFTATAKVDRYGRRIQSDVKKKALRRLYQTEEDEEQDGNRDVDEHGSNDEDEVKGSKDDDEEDDGAEDDDEDDDGTDDEDNDGADPDEILQRELRAAHEDSAKKTYDPARQGGFESSDSDSSSDSESDNEDGDNGQIHGAALQFKGDLQRFQEEQEEIESGEVTRRIAIVNLDWDHITSTDLLALFSSFITSKSGRILKVSIYPSEFGKERMKQEDMEGPPKDLFQKNSSSDSGSDSESESSDSDDSEDEEIKKELMQEGDDQDFDSDALRAYQLDRLRYYYAVMECSSPATAQQIYETTDGTEYQSSSNVIDLRFVPDDVTFDDEPRDECDKVPESYKPIEFVTKALQSSKVKLTWDMHPEEASRKESIKRAFSGSRADIGENDLRAYLASDSEGDESGGSDQQGAEGVEGGAKLSKRELARKKMRQALGLGDEQEGATKSSADGPVGEMQITFAPALTDDKSKREGEEETTIEKYRRKEKEKKEKKRLAAKAKRGTTANDVDGTTKAAAGDDLGFEDPFFTTEEPAAASKTSIRKEDRRKKREAREAADATAAEEKARLSKIMADKEEADHLDHFDMSEIVRAEKKKSKKAKGKAKQDAANQGGLQEDFEMDVADDRFKAVFDSHEFAIDPSNPKFKATGGMKKLLEEGRKKRKAGGDADEGGGGGRPKAKRGKRQ
ncbi:hypothetical protein CDD81_616 [Ophiocordyceps australis]|uniref:Uncharacterized protein n=1 Tax=Ophiocordyceps australis TaxID=1399860 RepID=A0A2C5YGS3_9HYPO|nr:hypothetical protein CDD81_616 [Ophiocordyceps australis]